jgi:methionyl aminopeptidase
VTAINATPVCCPSRRGRCTLQYARAAPMENVNQSRSQLLGRAHCFDFSNQQISQIQIRSQAPGLLGTVAGSGWPFLPRSGGLASGHSQKMLSRADIAWLLVTCVLLHRLLAIQLALQVQLKTGPDQQAGMRRAGAQAAQLLTYIDAHVRPGVSTAELDQLAHRYTVLELGATSAPLHYGGLIGGALYDMGIPPPALLTAACGWMHAATHSAGLRGLSVCGFPASTCISVNDCVCHGVPGERQLQRGDIVNIDVTVITPEGWHGDSSRMWIVGGPQAADAKAAALVADTREAMWQGIRQVRPGNHIGDIGHAIQTFAEPKGYGIVREFFGHGIGQRFHESPMVPHFGEPGTGALLEVGMIITVEPMLNMVRRPPPAAPLALRELRIASCSPQLQPRCELICWRWCCAAVRRAVTLQSTCWQTSGLLSRRMVPGQRSASTWCSSPRMDTKC